MIRPHDPILRRSMAVLVYAFLQVAWPRVLMASITGKDRRNNDNSSQVRHCYAFNPRNACSNDHEGAPVFWSLGRCASSSEHRDPVAQPF